MDRLKISASGISEFDFFVNGRSLLYLLDPDSRSTNISALSCVTTDNFRLSLRELMLERPSELESGRIPIYVCRHCGDFHCGAFAVRVTRPEPYCFTWTDFAYEDGIDICRLIDRPKELRFPAEDYLAGLEHLAGRAMR